MLIALLALSTTLAVGGQQPVPAPSDVEPRPLVSGARYDPAIPTFERVLGYEPGAEITPPDRIVAYLTALAAAAPDRARLFEYARTWEGRPLVVLAIGAPARLAALDQVKAGLRRLADPRGLAPAEAARLIDELPVVTWLMHAVHGNEISSSDAALSEAYHLLAARDDEVVDLILRESIVLIDPLENPDGRARFVFQNLLGRAAEPDPEPLSAEHDEPWPGGRANHYLFDLNRDWFSQSQPETRGRTGIFLEWYPHVVVDLHEMGGEGTYYFAPPADPLNPHITKQQVAWFETFGRANGRRFDERGFPYFIRETYDSFYPGYGESWPIFQGSIGMTYEKASARGLVYRRQDGTLLRYRDALVEHFTAAMSTAETAARHRAAILRDFHEYRRTAVTEGEQGPVRAYALVPGGDPSRAARLAHLLVRQGFEVDRTLEDFRAGDREFPAGSYLASAAQPSGRLLRNLLERHVPQPEPFVAEQNRRRTKRLGDQIYDVTAWSLPLVFDVEAVSLDRAVAARTTRVTAEGAGPAGPGTAGSNGAQAAVAPPPATVGYLMPWGSAAAAVVAEALVAELRLRTVREPFTLAGRAFPAGTLIARRAENTSERLQTLAALVARHGAELVPVDSTFVDAGMSLGSNQVSPLTAPRVVLAWDPPTQSLSAGWARYVLERRFGQPVTVVRVGTLPRYDLRRADVIVLPSGSYGTAIAADLVRRLKDWVRAGGTLITLGEATRWAAGEQVDLLSTTAELRDGRPDRPADDKTPAKDPVPQPIDYDKSIQPARERPESLPGAILRVRLDTEHWLSAGLDDEIQVIAEGDRVFTPLKLDSGRNVGVYAEKERLVAAGLVWDDAQPLIAHKAYLMHQPLGQGHVIAFAEDPNFRAFTEASELLFLNAVLLGPSR
jgi:hypothetical protein